jgi:ParB-like chromosome segregation protein Spo0J
MAKATKAPPDAGLTRFARGEVRRVHRRDLRGAPYNPRKISDEQAKTLRKSLRTHGVLGLPVWNEASGNIVSGHQRVTALDALERGDDYFLDVQVVSLTEKEEREANVALNSVNAQGEYDFALLAEMFKGEASLDLGAMCMTEADLAFVDQEGTAFEHLFGGAPDAVVAEAEKIKAIKERRKEYLGDVRAADDPEFCLVVVFRDRADLAGFLDRRGIATFQKYVSGAMVEGWITGHAGS